MALSERSRSRLQGVHPDLVRVITQAAETGPPFIITEGVRSKERQRELVKKGASRTLNSRHLTGHAVDVADVEATYAPQKMKAIADAIKQSAKDCGVKCTHGIDWGWDSPHHELDRKKYPASGVTVSEKITEVAKVAANARVVTGATAGAAAVAASPETAKDAVSAIPPVPAVVTETLSTATDWQVIGVQLWTLKDWAIASWHISVPLGIICALIALWPKKRSEPG